MSLTISSIFSPTPTLITTQPLRRQRRQHIFPILEDANAHLISSSTYAAEMHKVRIFFDLRAQLHSCCYGLKFLEWLQPLLFNHELRGCACCKEQAAVFDSLHEKCWNMRAAVVQELRDWYATGVVPVLEMSGIGERTFGSRFFSPDDAVEMYELSIAVFDSHRSPAKSTFMGSMETPEPCGEALFLAAYCESQGSGFDLPRRGGSDAGGFYAKLATAWSRIIIAHHGFDIRMSWDYDEDIENLVLAFRQRVEDAAERGVIDMKIINSRWETSPPWSRLGNFGREISGNAERSAIFG